MMAELNEYSKYFHTEYLSFYPIKWHLCSHCD